MSPWTRNVILATPTILLSMCQRFLLLKMKLHLYVSKSSLNPISTSPCSSCQLLLELPITKLLVNRTNPLCMLLFHFFFGGCCTRTTCNIMLEFYYKIMVTFLFFELHWPGDSEGTLQSSSQAATCPPVYCIR